MKTSDSLAPPQTAGSGSLGGARECALVKNSRVIIYLRSSNSSPAVGPALQFIKGVHVSPGEMSSPCHHQASGWILKLSAGLSISSGEGVPASITGGSSPDSGSWITSLSLSIELFPIGLQTCLDMIHLGEISMSSPSKNKPKHAQTSPPVHLPSGQRPCLSFPFSSQPTPKGVCLSTSH